MILLRCDPRFSGHVVQITGAGIAVRKPMWPIYQQSLVDIFEGQISVGEVDMLIGLLGRIGCKVK
jgi:hypothetical protein